MDRELVIKILQSVISMLREVHTKTDDELVEGRTTEAIYDLSYIKKHDINLNDVKQTLEKINDINDEYNRQSLVEDSKLDSETKLRVLYEYGKQLDYGQSSAWIDAVELTLDVLNIKVVGVN